MYPFTNILITTLSTPLLQLLTHIYTFTSSRANVLATGVNCYIGNAPATPSSTPATKLKA
jgi:hypothetical protein